MIKSLILFALISTYLLGCQSKDVEKIEVVTLVKSNESWNGTVLPKYLDGKPEITILKITIPPHSILPTHKHSEINAGILMKGKLTVISEMNDTLYLSWGSNRRVSRYLAFRA